MCLKLSPLSVPVSPPSRRATCLARSPAGISPPKATWMFASSTMGAAPFTLFEVSQFQKHLERACGRAVDVVTAKQIKNPNLAAAIEREKVLVYER